MEENFTVVLHRKLLFMKWHLFIIINKTSENRIPNHFVVEFPLLTNKYGHESQDDSIWQGFH